MRKIFITFTAVLAVGMFTALTGCSNTATDQKAGEDEEAKTEQVEAQPAEPETPAEPTTFTTAKGTFNIEKALNRMYEEGVPDGTGKKSLHDRIPSSFPKSKMRKEAEKFFKQKWVIYYGMPDNDEAQAVYEKAREQYLKGFDDGWNF